MAPSKAVAWPDEIYDDEDVMSLDAQGRFIICRVCAESFIVYGGKTPKPVTMNACFRIRAWETHKRRTRAHRMKESRDTDSGFPQRRSSDSDLGSVPSVRSTRGGQGSTIFEQYVDNANSYRLNAQSFPVTAVDPTRFMGLPSFEDLAASVGESSSTSQRWSQPKSKRLEAALPSLPRDFARAFTQEHADFHSREVSGSGNPLALDRILNPLSSDDEPKQAASVHNANANAVKRQRTEPADTSGSAWSVSKRRNKTDALYWKTMRKVFAPAGASRQSAQGAMRSDPDG